MLDGVPDPLRGRGDFGRRTAAKAAEPSDPMLLPGETNEKLGDLPQRFRLLPNYIGPC